MQAFCFLEQNTCIHGSYLHKTFVHTKMYHVHIFMSIKEKPGLAILGEMLGIENGTDILYSCISL